MRELSQSKAQFTTACLGLRTKPAETLKLSATASNGPQAIFARSERMKKSPGGDGPTASQRITNLIADLGDWRGKILAQLREVILDAAPGITEEWKWGTAVWTNRGLVCSAGAFKDHVKLNFFKGAFLKDAKHLFNAGLDAKATRAIDFHEGDAIDASALKILIRAAIAYNQTPGTKK